MSPENLSAVQTVSVTLPDCNYDIQIGRGTLAQLGRLLQTQPSVSSVVVVTDSTVKDLFGKQVCDSLAQSGFKHTLLTVPAGEESKSIEWLEKLWDETLSAGADRKSVVVALGGGVVGDLSGYLAASYVRGISLVQLPTTLLAQVDSSVGGKVGINLPAAKNMVGAFHQPIGVLVDTDTLATLPEREYRAGLAEVVKYGVILDEAFFAFLEENVAEIQSRDANVLRKIITRCCELKAAVVRQDPREENGFRAVLNYGHTFAHAFEACVGYGTLLHGEAVWIGMVCAARLAAALGRVDEEFCRRQFQLLSALQLATSVPEIDVSEIIDSMQHDKKTEHGRLRFVLPTRLGHVALTDDVPENLVRAALQND